MRFSHRLLVYKVLREGERETYKDLTVNVNPSIYFYLVGNFKRIYILIGNNNVAKSVTMLNTAYT